MSVSTHFKFTRSPNVIGSPLSVWATHRTIKYRLFSWRCDLGNILILQLLFQTLCNGENVVRIILTDTCVHVQTC